MPVGRDASVDEAIELLLDLKHDLGKYLRLPLAYLPREAPPAEVRRALHRALVETRTGPSGATPARALWQQLRLALGGRLDSLPAFVALDAAVGAALAWEAAATDPAAVIDRTAAERDLFAVETAISAVIEELS